MYSLSPRPPKSLLTFVLTHKMYHYFAYKITLMPYYSVNVMFHSGQPIGSGEVVIQLALLQYHGPWIAYMKWD